MSITSGPTRIVVLAKAPLPGRSKTRLTPPYTPEQAAAVAEACLRDTLDTICRVADARPSWDWQLSLAGTPGSWLPAMARVVPQCEGNHQRRIGHAIEKAVQPAGGAAADAVILIGMDTPQVTAEHMEEARQSLLSFDATLGLAEDGGWWLLGLRAPYARRATTHLAGIPTSTAQTGALQYRRLIEHGLTVGTVPVLRDIDTAQDLEAVVSDLRNANRNGNLTALAESLRIRAFA